MTYLNKAREHSINGVSGTLSEVLYSLTDGHIMQQVWRASRGSPEGTVNVAIRFDDSCKNGHPTFSVTGSRGGREFGCIHDTIAKAFPELAPLIKWHLVSTDGPMHYIANTVYWAKQGNNLKYARSTAIWPDATDAELAADEKELTRMLTLRLPLLMAQFHKTMADCGLVARVEIAKKD